MGYDLHITRKTNWSDDTGPSITEAEWRAVVAGYSLETDALRYDSGEVSAKNPAPPLIATMVRVARELGAQVQGDDGEIYREDATFFHAEPSTPAPPRPDILSRARAWWRGRKLSRELRDAAPRFRVGQRVRDPRGVLATVTHVDPNANHGLGSVRIRLDDGRELHVAYVASGLKIVSGPVGGE